MTNKNAILRKSQTITSQIIVTKAIAKNCIWDIVQIQTKSITNQY